MNKQTKTQANELKIINVGKIGLKKEKKSFVSLLEKTKIHSFRMCGGGKRDNRSRIIIIM